MAFVFPLSRAAFLGALRVQDVVFTAPRQVQMSGTGGGEILTAEVAPQLWAGTVSLAPMRARDAAEVEVMLEALTGPGRVFEAFKANQIGPAADRLGATLGASVVSILDVDQPGSRVRLQGLPAFYPFTAGDFLSFAYGPAPQRQALHRIQVSANALGSGETPWLSIGPHLRAGAQIGAPVELLRPFCRAVLVPGSVSPGVTRNKITSGIGFDFRQTLR